MAFEEIIGAEHFKNRRGISKDIVSLIIDRWRNYRFLDGLTPGSINEWRVAYSMEQMAYYLIINKNETCKNLELIIFPIIRRCLTKNKHKIARILAPEEVLNILKNSTVEELLEHTHKILKNKITLYTYDCFWNLYKKILMLTNVSIYDAMKDILTQKNKEFVNTVLDCDIEAELCWAISTFICDKDWERRHKKNDKLV